MSHARDQIMAVLDDVLDDALDQVDHDYLADRLMPVVRDNIARGFEKAATVLQDELDDEPHAARWLRKWADDARADRRPAEG